MAKKSRYLLVCALILSLLVPAASCTGSSHDKNENDSFAGTEWLDEVNRAWVVAHAHNWDMDAEDDGIRVYVELQDEDEKLVEYLDANMAVAIEVYSTESKTYPREPSRLLYSGTSILDDWYEDAFVTGARGVKDIAWEDIAEVWPPEDAEYGMLYVTITLPDGETCSAVDETVRIVAAG